MNDLEIYRNTIMLPISDIGSKVGIEESSIEIYGKYKGKVTNYKKRRDGKLILVTAINPSPYGEGKTTVTIGLTDALNKSDVSAIAALREPSLGPVFGMKGCATGGGHAQVIPMDDINLHLTGDMEAITAANNLLCAAVDNHIFQGNKLGIEKVEVHRCIDVNDRALRKVVINGREDYFTITAASEVMAILCLSSDIKDLKERLGNIIIGYDKKNKPILAKKLKVEGSMAVILKDAINPNILQTLENNPVLMHGGPFANIAHGCSSIIATKTGLDIADYVVTEAGFGADLGAEKFFDIKCRTAKIKPDAVVLVVTTKALKYQAGVKQNKILEENLSAIKEGISNLEKHIGILNKYKVNFIVTLNKYNTDKPKEIKYIKEYCLERNIEFEICESYKLGSNGAYLLAEKVINLTKKPNNFELLYKNNLSIEDKISTICNNIYYSSDIEYSQLALDKIKGLDKEAKSYPVCISKSQYEITPEKIFIRDIKVLNGAKMITVLLNDIMTMPGLPKSPNYEQIDIDKKGNIVGLI